jgi:hypothetical protein
VRVAPVTEMNYLRSDRFGVEGSLYLVMFHISPGITLITKVLALTLLVQGPVCQVGIVTNMEQGPRQISGLDFFLNTQ